MKTFLLVLSVAALASAGTLGGYNMMGGGNDPKPGGGYGNSQPQPSYGGQSSSGDYGSKPSGDYCRTVYEDVPKQHCEDYSEKICRTTQKESCSQFPGQNCRGVISASSTRQCFNVNETRCTLKEDIKYETVDVPFVVQKCTKVNERVCDTLHDAQVNDKEELQCINVEREECVNEEQIINDKTCKTTINFYCQVDQGGYGQQPQSYGQPPQTYGGQGSGSSGGYGDSSSMNPYGQPKVNCQRTPETQCYNIPRSVSKTRCSKKNEKQCEKLKAGFATVSPQNACHNEEKKVCQLEHRQQPKQVKKYEYTQECEQVPREICETINNEKLVPSCVPTSHTQCTYMPMEQCEDIPKKYCFQYTVQVPKQDCSPPSGYPAPSQPSQPSTGYPSPSQPSTGYPSPSQPSTGYPAPSQPSGNQGY